MPIFTDYGVYRLWGAPMSDDEKLEDEMRDEGKYLDEIESTNEELLKRITILEAETLHLKEENRRVESDKRYMESELNHLQNEIKRLKTELDRLKNPPLIIGTIKSTLPNGKIIVKSTTGPTFIVNRASHVEKDNLLPGARVALNKQSLAIMGVLPPSKDPIVIGAEIVEKPTVTYDDIGGLEEQILEIKESVEEPMIKPELFKKVGIDPPKGVLLVGAPGVGKTLLAKAVANKTNATFIRFVGSELVQKYIGEGARLVRELFDMAKEKTPTIVFIDELDAIGAKRLEVSTSGDREVQRTLIQLLAELDGFDPIGDVKLIAATNRPDILDDALLRPGRFDRIIELPVPTYEARLAIFKIHLKDMNTAKNLDVESLATKSDGATGADIKSICMEAGMFAIRDGRNRVDMPDLEKAIDKVQDEGWLKVRESRRVMVAYG
jgi:proteasome regulatory subunit